MGFVCQSSRTHGLNGIESLNHSTFCNLLFENLLFEYLRGHEVGDCIVDQIMTVIETPTVCIQEGQISCRVWIIRWH